MWLRRAARVAVTTTEGRRSPALSSLRVLAILSDSREAFKGDACRVFCVSLQIGLCSRFELSRSAISRYDLTCQKSETIACCGPDAVPCGDGRTAVTRRASKKSSSPREGSSPHNKGDSDSAQVRVVLSAQRLRLDPQPSRHTGLLSHAEKHQSAHTCLQITDHPTPI